jgi:hypothetical protein
MILLPPPPQFQDTPKPPDGFRDTDDLTIEFPPTTTTNHRHNHHSSSGRHTSHNHHSSSSDQPKKCSCLSETGSLLLDDKSSPQQQQQQKKPSTTFLTPSIPYFMIPDELRVFHPKGLHLIICVHGLDGSCHDLRLFKIYLEVSLSGQNVHFLMSEKNQVRSLQQQVFYKFFEILKSAF